MRKAKDAVIGSLGVRDVGAGGAGHVATGAVRLAGVVLYREGLTVTAQTFAAVIGSALRGDWRGMRIVASGARHGIA